MIEISESMIRRQLARDIINLEESLGIYRPLVPPIPPFLRDFADEIRPYLPKSRQKYITTF